MSDAGLSPSLLATNQVDQTNSYYIIPRLVGEEEGGGGERE